MMKKIAGLMLALVLSLSLCIPAFANEPEAPAPSADAVIDPQSSVSDDVQAASDTPEVYGQAENSTRSLQRTRTILTYTVNDYTFHITLYGYFNTMEQNGVQVFNPNTCSVSVRMISQLNGITPTWEKLGDASEVSKYDPQVYKFYQYGYICYGEEKFPATLENTFYCSDGGAVS